MILTRPSHIREAESILRLIAILIEERPLLAQTPANEVHCLQMQRYT